MDDKDENYVRPVPAREFIDRLKDFKQGELRNIEIIPTIRDQFAMAALTGLLANVTACNEIRKIDETKITENMAMVCFSYSDAMMKAREQDSE